MRTLFLTGILLLPLVASSLHMPKDKKYYISGIEFDTKVYCADYAEVIDAQAARIKELEAQVASLQHIQQELIKKEQSTQKEEKPHTPKSKTDKTKSMIIISDRPI